MTSSKKKMKPGHADGKGKKTQNGETKEKASNDSESNKVTSSKKKMKPVPSDFKGKKTQNGETQEKASSYINSSETYEISQQDLLLIVGYGMLVGAIYIFTMYPTISAGDSGELIAAAHELGIAHPPGYPLFTMLAWLFINGIPFGSVAWRVNLLNALFAGLAAFMFTLAIHRYTKSIGCSVFGASLWAFCKITWTWSSNAEVFGLNNFFITSILYLMVVFQDAKEENKEKVAYFGAFFCGLALCNQHTTVVYVIIVGAWVLVELKHVQKLTFLCLLKIGLCFVNGLVPYMYLPIAASLKLGRWTWGDQTTMEGFIKHFLRQEYGTFDLARDPDGTNQGMAVNLNKYFTHVTSEFTVFGLILCVIGIYSAAQRSRREQKQGLFVSFAMALIYLMFFSWRANLDLSNELFLGVVERFWMQCDAVLVLLAAVGFNIVLRMIEDKAPSVNTRLGSLSIALFVLAFQLGKNLPSCNQSNNRIIEEFGHRILYNLPKNTFLLQVGDLSSNLFRYQYLCEKHRPDIAVLDVELMTYPWAVPFWRHKYPEVTFPGDVFHRYDGKIPDGGVIFSFKTFLMANYHRPIIACIGMKTHEYITKEGFELLPFGPCSIVAKQPVNFEQTYYPLIDLALNVSEGWSYKYESQAPTSWERVAAGEMWNARVNIPLFLYYKAEKEQNVEIMKRAYLMYKKAIVKLNVEDVPDYYHKNFALCCDKMLNMKHNIPKSDILNEAIEHFTLFVQKNPGDKDVPAIRNVIRSYKKHVGKL